MQFEKPPIVWSIAGNDSGGGAGLSADQRAATAFGVHLCPVVAAITAQSSVGVAHIEPTSSEVLEAQLAALAEDMPPAVIKTGMLGNASNVMTVARWVDRLRERGTVALVIDPVLGSTTGASFANESMVQAYREWLLPRATLITPNESEARRLAADGGNASSALTPTTESIPTIARNLRALGAAAVAVTCGDTSSLSGQSVDWVDTPHAAGWLALPRVDTANNHGTGCTFATSAAAAMALGFVAADALVLAKMATTHALLHGYAAGQGAGPVASRTGFANIPELMPQMSWGERFEFRDDIPAVSASQRELDLYAIVDSADRVVQVVAAGIKTVQLRVKEPPAPDDAWWSATREAIQKSVATCRSAGALLIVNDHWRLAHELGASAVHVGQEDLLALGDAGRAELASTGMRVGVSSHSLWELARARSLNPLYVACGPVWPTLTKAMPWRPQGLDNLAWWVQMAGVPVVAIGGILEPGQLTLAAQSGASGVCVVRGLGDDPSKTVPAWQEALVKGRAEPSLPIPSLPHPSLDTTS
ncbi:MAG: bifunctional hydroxymethylpyrimidine kinase/phosphomethylpyrimidine kinase [Comamonadaceae bacterium]|nr:bifunctional hydroxymethylpyrimidine kinase/phosphomethylpyrimidine kinase [Comamonadaceae bacterium]